VQRNQLLTCATIFFVLTGYSKEPSTDEFVKIVEKGKIGSSADDWIELRNSTGEWEKVGLIFGYYGGEHEECEKARQGLKKVNYTREYRCIAAQVNRP
jgi:hypothetical protein